MIPDNNYGALESQLAPLQQFLSPQYITFSDQPWLQPQPLPSPTGPPEEGLHPRGVTEVTLYHSLTRTLQQNFVTHINFNL